MMRTLFALALACVSYAAIAGPPGPPPVPVDVNVTNTVLPVEVSNADPIPVQAGTHDIADLDNQIGIAVIPSIRSSDNTVVLEAAVLIGLQVQVDASASSRSSDACGLVATLQRAGTIRHLLRVAVAGGARDSIYLPLPNILVSDGDFLIVDRDNNTDATCLVVLNVQAVSP
jgi:hypothetical protein